MTLYFSHYLYGTMYGKWNNVVFEKAEIITSQTNFQFHIM
jgi:hypothetical protein